MARALSRNSCPSSVSSMRRVVRVSSDVASLSSSRDRARLTPEVVCPRCTAAALRVPLSMTVTKIFRSSELISIAMPYYCRIVARFTYRAIIMESWQQ